MDRRDFTIRLLRHEGGECLGLFPVSCDMEDRTLEDVKADLIDEFPRVWGSAIGEGDYFLDVRPGLRLAHSRH